MFYRPPLLEEPCAQTLSGILEYCIMRQGVPFSLKSLEDIITEETKELLSLIYEEVEDDLNYRVKLDVDIFFFRAPF